MSRRTTFFLLLFFIAAVTTSAQDANVKKLEREANRYFNQEAYHKALPLFLKLDSLFPDSREYNFKTGQCYYHTVDKNLSLKYFKIAEAQGERWEELDYYIGRAYHFNHQFDKAIEYYRQFQQDLLELDQTDDERFYEVELFVGNCELGKLMLQDSMSIAIENIGGTINSEFPDYVPVIPANEDFMLFTSRRSDNIFPETDFDGQYYEDIFISYRDGDKWSEPENLGEDINTWQHDACIGLSFDGAKLLVYKSVNGGDVYVSDHQEDGSWSPPTKILGEVNSNGWESSACFNDDLSQIYFTSDRPGGFGGSDIYVADLDVSTGAYVNARNLGPIVNSPYDEDAPHLHTDGKTLFFSSRGHPGMGGFDIYSSIFDEESETWSHPANIGYPINTADDDIYFTLTGDGSKAYFSSYRSDTYGEKDLYVLKRPNLSPSKFYFNLRLNGGETAGAVPGKLIMTNVKTGAKEVKEVDDVFSKEQVFVMEFNEDYELEIDADGYATHTEPLNIEKQVSLFEFVMKLNLKKQEIIVVDVEATEAPEEAETIAEATTQPNEVTEETPGDEPATAEETNESVTKPQETPEPPEPQETPVAQKPQETPESPETPETPATPEAAAAVQDETGPTGETEPETGSVTTPDANPADFQLRVIQFEFDDYSLNNEATIFLNSLSGYLQANSKRVLISGYTDTYGPADYNLYLSQMRAKEVKKYLESKGIDSNRIESSGYGEADPVSSNESLETRKLNRRVQIRLTD